MVIIRRLRFFWSCLCLLLAVGTAALALVPGPSQPTSPWAVVVAAAVAFYGLALSWYGRPFISAARQFLFAGILPAFFAVLSFGQVPAPAMVTILTGTAVLGSVLLIAVSLVRGFRRGRR
ncbi:hypothetical protein [Ottowia sp.]|uniref:hypothetical protein n=1 Tax=Ottowia sp. TaxID=1898956 RepID=UPI002B58F348|nr:hypothetical protein [Ottowia sp.]HOB65285.1 hypothetical protein [Ottowia sp.]